jgi:acyl-coenzyme A synthetase/AMP-(fatty) acid ligase
MNMLSLLQHRSDQQTLAWRDDRPVSVAQFLREVRLLAALLPEHRYLFNLCADRYRFLVTFCAALLRGQTNLLPPNHAENTLSRLHADYPDTYGVSDHALLQPGLEMLAYPEQLSGTAGTTEIPSVAENHTAAIVFTSGSTGQPQPHPKSWGSLVKGAQLAADNLGIVAGHHFLGTVPPQHMYGLEASLMLPLHSGGVLHAGQPLFPADIRLALLALPTPRVLVTTPLHLRICLEENIALPALSLILSAAAHLSAEQAQRAEKAFSAPVKEIYGCTEAGAVATRRTIEGEAWKTMAGVHLSLDDDGQAWVQGGHVSDRAPLQDVIELMQDTTRFRLLGRKADLVNVAGKRASLGDLNRQLLQIPGVHDGVFFAPDDQTGTAVRLTALVVAPELSAADIMTALRRQIDPAFLPRPLYKVNELPRSASGKLPRASLSALLAGLQRD